MNKFLATLLMLLAFAANGCTATAHPPAGTLRVAVIGGMTDTGFWQALTKRFTQQTNWQVDIISTGPKGVISDAFRSGKADLITMHASDAIINLVADGDGLDPQPWLRNDLVIVGPPSDPAGIRGMTDAAAALQKIHDSHSHFVVHSSLGAQEVLSAVLANADVNLDPQTTTILMSDRAREVLKIAARQNAYTLVGRIPFLNGKLPNDGLQLMVRGDPQLRRPYLVVVANPEKFPAAHIAAARRLAAFLRTEETQQWIADYGRGQIDENPLFFRVHTNK